MKSTSQARKRRSFPLTDYNYLPTAETQTGAAAGRPAKKSPAFHKLSSEFFGGEMSRVCVAELLFFALLTGVSGWPIVWTLVAVTRLVRNY
jgi:hypothetical protein